MASQTSYRCPAHGFVPVVQTTRARRPRGFKHTDGCGLRVEVTTTIECSDHEVVAITTWGLESFEALERGDAVQVQCRECRLWFFPWERK